MGASWWLAISGWLLLKSTPTWGYRPPVRTHGVRPVKTTCPVEVSRGAVSRRDIWSHFVAPVTGFAVATASRAVEEAAIFELPNEYSSPDGSFSFRYPDRFDFAPKLVKIHQQEINVKSKELRGFTAGVAVDPVKINSLEEFGAPAAVGERVVSLERAKDGVHASELFASRAVVRDGVTYYDIEYSSESSHGMNRYSSRLAINSKKLVVCTVQVKIKDAESVSGQSRAILDSFRVRAAEAAA